MKPNNIINRSMEFPDISFAEFQSIPYIDERKAIASRNKIMKTDAYNRTMDYTKEEKSDQEESFYLSFRQSPNEAFNVIYWVKNIVDEILRTPITQKELDFARDFYHYQTQKWWNWVFNAQRWQKIIDNNNGMLPIKVFWVADGTILLPWEPALRVEGPSEFAAIYEPIFLQLFYQTVTATSAKMIEEIIGEGRAVEFWYRASINDKMHMDGMESVYVWSGINKTSSDISAAALDMVCDGTTAHRFFTTYITEDEAMIQAIQKNNKIWLLVDSIDPYKWIDKVAELKKHFAWQNKIIAPRLDSGNIAHQAIYALNKFKEVWVLGEFDKIIAADISTIEDIVSIERAVRKAWFDPIKHITYGLGWLLIAKDKTRDVVSAWYKLSQTERWATMKFANGKVSIPWKPNIEIRDGARYIVQEDEIVKGLRLLTPMYDNWKFFYDRPKITDMQKARDKVITTRSMAEMPGKYSKKTQELITECRKRVGIAQPRI